MMIPAKSKLFMASLEQAGLPLPRMEYEFHHERNWRADYCWPSADHMLILEVEGGVWVRGRHTRGKGYLADVEKYNAAACCGYRLIRVTPADLMKTKTLALITEALRGAT